MSSFIVKLKNVEKVAPYFLKFEGLQNCGTFQRYLHSSSFLFSSITKEFIIHDLRDSSQANKNPNFGKVVDLGSDFDDMKQDDEDQGKSKIKPTVNSTNEQKSHRIKEVTNIHEGEDTLREECYSDNESDLESNEKENDSNSNEVKKQQFKISIEDKYEFGKIMTKLKLKKFRMKEQKIFLEGKRLIHDAISAGHKPLKVFFSRFDDLRSLNLPEEIKVTQVSYKSLNIWSDVVTSQGVIGVFKIPKLHKVKLCNETIPLTVVCDNIRDPGNLGSILRTGAAVGCRQIILTPGCVDIWEPKVLRAGAGAHFRLPILNNLTWPEIENVIPSEIQVVLADNKSPADFNESSQEKSQTNNTFCRRNEVADSLPLCCYTSFQFEPSGVVMILGGETSGLSDEASLFAKNRNGSRVYLPMCYGTESLNSALSLGILSYEFRRQISCMRKESSEEAASSDDCGLDREG